MSDHGSRNAPSRSGSGLSTGSGSRGGGGRTMNAPTSVRGKMQRGQMKRSQSFKRTSANPTATTAEANADLVAELANFDTRPEPRQGAATGMARTPSSGSAASGGFGTHTSTSNFVKNFLEEDDDPNNLAVSGSGSNSGIQFDAETQRNVHSSLLSPTPDSPPSSPERARRAMMNLNVSSSLHSRNTRLSSRNLPSAPQDQQNLFQQRDGFNYVDQSVNLMDAEAGKYESKDRRRSTAGNATSMVEIFLKDSGAAVSEEITKTTQWWHHPQRREQWNRMTAWEKIKEVSARCILPLSCCCLIFLVILCILSLYNKAETAVEGIMDVANIPTDSSIPGKTEAMQAVAKQLVQLKIATPEQLKDTSSPSYQALDWISTDEIALNGAPDQERRRRRVLQESQDRLVQRYVLAVLHFSWKGLTNNGKNMAQDAIQDMGLLGAGASSQEASQDNLLWLTPQSECNWKGVQCHDEAKTIDTTVGATQVRALNLTQYGLEGTLPMEVSFLTNLVELDLRKNKLSGPITTLNWNNWKKMEYLLLGTNEFNGRIPDGIGEMQRLVDLDLSDNLLTGPLPGLRGKLEYLENIFVDGNALTGAIPPSFLKAMPHLSYLDVSENALTGPLPGAISELTSMRYFHAINNALTGNLPPEMARMEWLDTLSLDDNKLSGPFPDGIFSGMKRLRYLKMNGNSLNGPLPESVADMSKLKSLDFSENDFTGTIPSNWFKGEDKALVNLILSKNKLTGTIPYSIGNLGQTLEKLYLDSNELSGKLPTVMGELGELRMCYLSSNSFTGTIPDSWASMFQIEELELFDNGLEGAVPKALCKAEKDNEGTDIPISIVVDCKSGEITCDCCERCE